MVTNQLTANQFSMNWLDSLLGKSKSTEEKKQLTCAEMIAEYKEYWFRENKKLKSPKHSWYHRFRNLETVFSGLDKPISTEAIKQVIGKTDNHTFVRAYTLQALILFFDYFSLTAFNKIINQYKTKNKPKKKNKYVPNDGEIITIYNLGFEINPNCRKDYRYRYAQWRFLYGLLATYGLRIHEAWNIANWDKPVMLKDEDWIEVTLEDETGKEDTFVTRYKGKDEIIPAIIDPDNELFVLAIKHDTKTGYRMAMPLSPIGHDWLKEFDLVGQLRLPDIENPLDKHGTNEDNHCCTSATCQWFKKHRYGFTPHALRHAYNHRAHQQDINPTTIAKSLGHSLQMNTTTYWKSMATSRDVQMMKQAITEAKNNQSELEKIKAECEYLKAENERLRTELRMYEAINKNK